MNNLPKLDFLYFNLEHTEENFFNSRELYYTQTGWDENHFDDYIKECSFEELIYLMVYIYRDKYPRTFFQYSIALDGENHNLLSYTNTNGRLTSEYRHDSSNFVRADVISMNSQYHNEEYTDEEMLEKCLSGETYMQNLFLEFNKDLPVEIIDKALNGKDYTKTEKDELVIYEVKDSPIASLNVTKNSIKLNINKDKTILYII